MHIHAPVDLTGNVNMRWMCGVSLKDRKRSVDLWSLLGVQSVDEVVRRGRLRWFGHVEHKSEDDWVSACTRWGRKNQPLDYKFKNVGGWFFLPRLVDMWWWQGWGVRVKPGWNCINFRFVWFVFKFSFYLFVDKFRCFWFFLFWLAPTFPGINSCL